LKSNTFALLLICSLTPLPVAANTNTVTADNVQVLVQGGDAEALSNAIVELGGRITHALPIINGIGGEIKAQALDALRQNPDVKSVTEDYNPSDPIQPRDCPVSGALDVAMTDDSVTWSIYNFSATSQEITVSHLSWPEALGNAQVVLQHRDSDAPISTFDWPTRHPGYPATLIPPGVTDITLAFTQFDTPPTQNDLTIELTLTDCTAELPRAYADNHADFYFPSVAGAALLHQAGITGKGVGVAVIDSGLWDVSALTRNTAGEYRVASHYDARHDREEAPLIDLGGHGSHMASIIGNSGAVTRQGGIGFNGMAPDATLIPITTFAPRGDADFMDIIRAIQWAVHNRERYNIRVLNMSLSATPRYMYWDEPLNQAVLKAWQAGITVVAAMGNDGPEWGTVGSPANNPYVISVGALTDSWTPNDRNDDYVPDFSSRGPTPAGHIKPDVVAPGGHITGLLPPDSELAIENPNYLLGTGEFVSTGSSQAAAVVSGMAALLLQANPELSNDDVKCLITSSAEPAINRDGRLAYSPFTQGAGYANVSRALTLGNTDCEQQKLDIDAAVAGDEQLIGPAERDDRGEPTLPTLTFMLSDKPSEKGFSNDRRWGVAEHLKRLDLGMEPAQTIGVPFDWGRLYEEERLQLERLSNSADGHSVDGHSVDGHKNP